MSAWKKREENKLDSAVAELHVCQGVITRSIAYFYIAKLLALREAQINFDNVIGQRKNCRGFEKFVFPCASYKKIHSVENGLIAC